MRRYHQGAGDAIGQFGTELAAHDVQATVDPRGSAGRGEYIAFVDIQHARIDLHLRKVLCKQFGPAPVLGGATPIEQTCLGPHIGAKTQANHRRTAPTCAPQGRQQRRWYRLVRIAPRRHYHDLRALQFACARSSSCKP